MNRREGVHVFVSRRLPAPPFVEEHGVEGLWQTFADWMPGRDPFWHTYFRLGTVHVHVIVCDPRGAVCVSASSQLDAVAHDCWYILRTYMLYKYTVLLSCLIHHGRINVCVFGSDLPCTTGSAFLFLQVYTSTVFPSCCPASDPFLTVRATCVYRGVLTRRGVRKGLLTSLNVRECLLAVQKGAGRGVNSASHPRGDECIGSTPLKGCQCRCCRGWGVLGITLILGRGGGYYYRLFILRRQHVVASYCDIFEGNSSSLHSMLYIKEIDLARRSVKKIPIYGGTVK